MPTNTFSRPGGSYPTGTIMVWTDSLSEIPGGWALCDGNNGTPNLLDRFPMSVPNSTTDPGGTGGQNSVTLATGQLPNHGHSLSVGTTGSHKHGFDRSSNLNSFNVSNDPWVWYPYSDQHVNSDGIGSAGSHSHTVTTNITGSDNSIDNQPNHYEVAFIKKI